MHNLSIELGTILAVAGLLLSFLGYQLSKTKEVKSDSEVNGQLRTELEYIRKGVDDIRIDIRANERQMAQLGERVTRVEESAKQAHKRLDSIELKEEK